MANIFFFYREIHSWISIKTKVSNLNNSILALVIKYFKVNIRKVVLFNIFIISAYLQLIPRKGNNIIAQGIALGKCNDISDQP
jgi:hypothetical protein